MVNGGGSAAPGGGGAGHVNNGEQSTISPAAAAVYSRLSPFDGLYSSPFHASPTAMSFRGLSPGMYWFIYPKH